MAGIDGLVVSIELARIGKSCSYGEGNVEYLGRSGTETARLG